MNARIAQPLRFGILLGLAVLGLTLKIDSALGQALPADKVSGEIVAHQKTKQLPAGTPLAAHRAALTAHGLNANNLDGEECALYSLQRLTQAEIDQLRANGIIVTPDLWIPPVPGKHLYGFHLAQVSYQSLDFIRGDARFTRLESTEFQNQPMNDLGLSMVNADDVHNGVGVPARNGSGVRIAVADSGLDVTHADFPVAVEKYDMTTGTSTADWSTNVANTVSPHGTHVTGTVLGRGTLSGGRYKGSAPGADLCFYKIGDNVTASASDTDEIEAINRALAVGAKIFTMSYGGFSTYMDGSESMEQAIDAAVAAGLTVFISAGNEGASSRHDSISVPPATTSATFSFTVDNSASGSIYTVQEWVRLIWRDNNSADGNMVLACTNLGAGESLTLAFSAASPRNTESRRYVLTPNIAAGATKTYVFTLQNVAVSGTTPLVHCYRVSGKGTFVSADPFYTIGHPACADSAIAVGAWTQRRSWTNYLGSSLFYADLTVGTLAPFSSRGPRVDGVRKPEIVAPGAATISARDSVGGLAATAGLIIDNDGLNQNGSGPANYYVMRGTSMASPLAAGVAGLLLQNNSNLTPAQVKSALTSTASQAGAPDDSAGYGLIDALAAIKTHPNLTIANMAVTEGNSGTVNAVFTVSLSAASVQNLSVNYATANGSATAGSDYVATNGVLTILAGATSGTITVPVNGDLLNESNETFFVNLSNPTNVVIADAQAQGTINNNDAVPTLSINDVTLAEGNSGSVNATFTVSLSAISGLSVSVVCATANDSATAGSDYVATNRVLTIAAGATSTTITVPVLGDTLYESNETFFVNLTNPTNATTLDAQGTGTINNDDTAPTLSINDVTLAEGNSGSVNATFTVSLSALSGLNVSVACATANGSATAGSDYVATNRVLTIAAGATSTTITVPVLGETLHESNETFFVNLTNPTNATTLDAQGVGTINNDDTAPTLSINDVVVTEGNTGTTNAVFTVSLSAISGLNVSVAYSTANSNATAGIDYVATNGVLNIPPGGTTGTITVPVVGDGLFESNETFLVNLSNATNATPADTQGVGTINNDDQLPVVNFTALPTNGPAPLIVIFTNLTSGATNYVWSFGDGKISGVINPTNAYTNAGVYTVQLTAIGAGGTNSLVRSNYIVVTNVPLSDFSLVRPGLSNSAFRVSVPTVNGSTYTLQFLLQLGASNWVSLPAVPGDGTVKILTDPSATNFQRSYRVIRQ